MEIDVSTTFINQTLSDLTNPFATTGGTHPIEFHRDILQSAAKTGTDDIESTVRLTFTECFLSEVVVQIIIEVESNNADTAWQAMNHIYGAQTSGTEPVLLMQFTFDAMVKIFSDSDLCIESIWGFFHQSIGIDTMLIESFLHTINAMQSETSIGDSVASIDLELLNDVKMSGLVNGVDLIAPSVAPTVSPNPTVSPTTNVTEPSISKAEQVRASNMLYVVCIVMYCGCAL